MYVSIASRTGGRKYLSIVHGYRDENGKVRKKTIRSLGYLDELEKEYEAEGEGHPRIRSPISKQLQKKWTRSENRRPPATLFASIIRKSFLSAQTI